MSVSQVIVDLCQVGQYQTGEHQQRQIQTQVKTNFKVFSTSFSEYLRHAPCMRQAQAEYESCADQYQLRIKTLNKVMMMMMMMMVISINSGKDTQQGDGGHANSMPAS